VPGELRALGVTARELEVLRLLAIGLPNKQTCRTNKSARACTYRREL
jgi:DNA-binding NarL/FixJ family response regulator